MGRKLARSRQNFGYRAASVSAVADYPHPLNPGRSANMRANRRKDTKPELALRRALHARGYRYRKDYRLELAGTRVRPDIAFTARRVAVFVDGCFWHCCPEHGSQPANNTWYWSPSWPATSSATGPPTRRWRMRAGAWCGYGSTSRSRLRSRQLSQCWPRPGCGGTRRRMAKSAERSRSIS
jgi:DNA mismatch endonuclease Vsr